MKKLILLIALTLPTFANAVPTGDTQGKVSAVIVHHNFSTRIQFVQHLV